MATIGLKKGYYQVKERHYWVKKGTIGLNKGHSRLGVSVYEVELSTCCCASVC